MIHIMTVFSILICLTALAGLVAPSMLTRLAAHIAASERLKVAATVTRLVFGGIAILVSNATLYPLVMKIIGVIAIMAGTATSFVSADARGRWVESIHRNKNWVRGLSLAGLLFGGFLMHAVL